MNKCMDRYVNNDLIGYISRPQHGNSCSFTALTAVFNYLFAKRVGIKTSNELAKAIGIKAPKDITGYGNPELLRFFEKLCKNYGVVGNCGYFLRGKDVKDWEKNTQIFSNLKVATKSPNTALIYHLSNHYNLIVGYFEHAVNPDDAYNPEATINRWVVIGEHSEYNPIPNLVQVAGKLAASFVHKEDAYNQLMERATLSPIWSRRWRDLRHDLMSNGNHCILRFNA